MQRPLQTLCSASKTPGSVLIAARSNGLGNRQSINKEQRLPPQKVNNNQLLFALGLCVLAMHYTLVPVISGRVCGAD
jgi:hypothetical protein